MKECLDCHICGKRIKGACMSLKEEKKTVTIHYKCYRKFRPLAMMLARDETEKIASYPLSPLAEVLNGEVVLVKRSYPSDIFPILIYLAIKNGEIVVNELTAWMDRNDISFEKVDIQMGSMKRRGLIQIGDGTIQITDNGREFLRNYIDYITSEE